MTLFLLVFYQDYRERQVYWFLFPLIALSCGLLFYNQTLPELFIVSVLLNGVFIGLLLLAAFCYSRLVLNIKFNEAFGLGDTLLFISLIFSFSTISFIVLFVFALVFSLIIHLILKSYSATTTVPLAGYLSLFFGVSYVALWSGLTNTLYAI
ncbi:hypothetical protein [uncultured Psychroserpens sp.]|uniref:hypothetical protein n=1 Tax=uncultured Psychroserpens sp. TaxID=255436 RepID=UPI002628A2F2|nr:hypothetical protein [uncultured Psychroserpens sp.]